MASKSIDFKIPFKDSFGLVVPGKTLASELSVFLGNQTSKEKSIKIYGWHKTLQVGDPLILDDADYEDLKDLIEKDGSIFIFFKGQLLETLKGT